MTHRLQPPSRTLLRGPDGRELRGPTGRTLIGPDGRALRNWRGEALSRVGTIVALLVALLLSGCQPYYLVGAKTGIPVACRVTERTASGFTCIDTYRQWWSCRWTPEDKEMDGQCSELKPMPPLPAKPRRAAAELLLWLVSRQTYDAVEKGGSW
jgi:hypothetical protein